MTGAGKTVAAALALGLAAGLGVETAAVVAKAAAGVAVGKVETTAVAPADLLAALRDAAPGFGPFPG